MSDPQPIEPINDWLFVRPLKYDGLIVMPDNAKAMFEQGDVVAAGPLMTGPDGRYVRSTIRAGHRVVFRSLRNDEVIDYGGEALILMKAKDVVGMVNPAAVVS